jgi:hypothetical protein
MMKKIYVNGVHDYDYSMITRSSLLEKNDKNYTEVTTHGLHYSNHHEWYETLRGKIAMEVVDTGDGIKFSKPLDELDYSEAQQLRILLGIIMKSDCEELQMRVDI